MPIVIRTCLYPHCINIRSILRALVRFLEQKGLVNKTTGLAL